MAYKLINGNEDGVTAYRMMTLKQGRWQSVASGTETDSNLMKLRSAWPNRVYWTKTNVGRSQPPFSWPAMHEQAVKLSYHALHFVRATYLLYPEMRITHIR